MAVYKKVLVNGISADLYLDQDPEEANVLIWVDESRGAAFRISAILGETELVKMAESVEAVPAGHRLEWVPEGYELVEETYGGYIFSVYSRPDGETILFSVYTYTDSLQIHVDIEEGDDYKQVQVSGRPADLYLDAAGEKGILIWMDETERIVFMLDGALTEEELIKIAEHVRRVPIPLTPHSPAWLPEGYRRKGYSGGEEHMEEWYAKDGSGQIRLHYRAEGLTEELQRELGSLKFQSTLVNGHPARLEYGGLMERLPEHTFSPAFERKMKKLLRRGQHPVWYQTLHAAACVLPALLLSGCAVLAVSPEARESFAVWMLEVYETAFVYFWGI